MFSTCRLLNKSCLLNSVFPNAGKGYVVPFECAEGLQTDELMMGILRVLTVSELREISCIPKKVCSCCLSCIYSLNVLSMHMIV